MYLKDQTSGDLVEVLNVIGLADPFQKTIQGRFHVGEELQDPMDFDKMKLLFPSGESLPQCWVDPNYKKK
jgi:hypothetical protein